ncbi:hypothetical protein KAURM247S_02783 [Kitasatospora aureofaciens]
MRARTSAFAGAEGVARGSARAAGHGCGGASFNRSRAGDRFGSPGAAQGTGLLEMACSRPKDRRSRPFSPSRSGASIPGTAAHHGTTGPPANAATPCPGVPPACPACHGRVPRNASPAFPGARPPAPHRPGFRGWDDSPAARGGGGCSLDLIRVVGFSFRWRRAGRLLDRGGEARAEEADAAEEPRVPVEEGRSRHDRREAGRRVGEVRRPHARARSQGLARCDRGAGGGAVLGPRAAVGVRRGDAFGYAWFPVVCGAV